MMVRCRNLTHGTFLLVFWTQDAKQPLQCRERAGACRARLLAPWSGYDNGSRNFVPFVPFLLVILVKEFDLFCCSFTILVPGTLRPSSPDSCCAGQKRQ